MYKNKKEELIRDMLLKTVGMYPELFTYYASILESKEWINKNSFVVKKDENDNPISLRFIAEV